MTRGTVILRWMVITTIGVMLRIAEPAAYWTGIIFVAGAWCGAGLMFLQRGKP